MRVAGCVSLGTVTAVSPVPPSREAVSSSAVARESSPVSAVARPSKANTAIVAGTSGGTSPIAAVGPKRRERPQSPNIRSRPRPRGKRSRAPRIEPRRQGANRSSKLASVRVLHRRGERALSIAAGGGWLVARISSSALVMVGWACRRSRIEAAAARQAAASRGPHPRPTRFGPDARTGVRAAARPGRLLRRRAHGRTRRRTVRSADRAPRGVVATPPQSRTGPPWSRRSANVSSVSACTRASRSRSVSIQRSNSARPGTLNPSRNGPPYRATALSSAPSAIDFSYAQTSTVMTFGSSRSDAPGGREDIGRQRSAEREDELFEVVPRALGIELRPEQRERAVSWHSVVAG